MAVTLKTLSSEMIEDCLEIQSWLNQFSRNKRSAAEDMLLKLQFVPRDVYAEWLKANLTNLSANPCAFYAVRKFDNEICLWDNVGKVVGRPSSSLGSEDLVQSIISNLIKSNKEQYLDNPDLEDLRRQKVRDIALLDDSIGSGDRVSTFIQMMMIHKTFRSWWSFGWIRLHIVAFAQTIEAIKRIVDVIPGSNHPIRKNPKSKKVNFISHMTYHLAHPSTRWGTNFHAILDLCRSQKEIPKFIRLGFDETMANIIFYHSVPDNIPGMLWYEENRNWTPLFPNRSVPEWLPRLLDAPAQNHTKKSKGRISKSLLSLLHLAKKGIRNEYSLARLIGLDVTVLRQLLMRGRESGFLTESNRLTKAGFQVVHFEEQKHGTDLFGRYPRAHARGTKNQNQTLIGVGPYRPSPDIEHIF